MKNWYAVSTKFNLEFIALENLQRQNIHTYLPKIYKKTSSRNNFSKNIYSAFFPGYLFVRLNLETVRWQKINSTIGVQKIVSLGLCPISIPNKIIYEIKKNEDENGLIKNIETFNKNDNILIETGIFSGTKVIFDRYVSGDNRVRVLMDLMGISTSINIGSHHIQKI